MMMNYKKSPIAVCNSSKSSISSLGIEGRNFNFTTPTATCEELNRIKSSSSTTSTSSSIYNISNNLLIKRKQMRNVNSFKNLSNNIKHKNKTNSTLTINNSNSNSQFDVTSLIIDRQYQLSNLNNSRNAPQQSASILQINLLLLPTNAPKDIQQQQPFNNNNLNSDYIQQYETNETETETTLLH
jgi:hypothetical protein